MGNAIWQVLTLLLVLAVVVQGVVLVALMRQVGGIIIQIRPPRAGALDDGPEVGSELVLPDAEPDRPAVVLFIAPDCGPCHELLPNVPPAVRSYREVQFLAVVTGSDEEKRRAYARTIEGITARPDLHFLEEQWRIPGTPYAVGLTEDGRVATAGVVNTLDHVEAVAEAVIHTHFDSMVTAGAPSTNGNRGSDEELARSSTNRLEGVDA
jgi:thiol-disulfide isomerase/thioredoxin